MRRSLPLSAEVTLCCKVTPEVLLPSVMPSRSEAEENLRVIRSLMEKATIYRAISAEAAAVGGVLALAASFAFGNWLALAHPPSPAAVSERSFVMLWLGVLGVTVAANIGFLWRDSRRRQEYFVSSGMRTALRALLPPYLVAAFCTAWTFFSFALDPVALVTVWIICHGLALLATSHFAPRSLGILGWMFLLSGLALTQRFKPIAYQVSAIVLSPEQRATWPENGAILTAQLWMALTFGLLHLIYAACTWPRRIATRVPVEA